VLTAAKILRWFSPARPPKERCPANLRFTFGYDGADCQAFSRDLSGSGAFLKTDNAPVEGAVLTLRFRLPGDPAEIDCKGIVRRIEHGNDPVPAGFGVEFHDMGPADCARLEEFIHRQIS
jgi:uncharacterized protein (TIGR02266 family)